MRPVRRYVRRYLEEDGNYRRTLAHMHGVSYANGLIVHRDVKPENIFLGKDDRLSGDFGGALTMRQNQ